MYVCERLVSRREHSTGTPESIAAKTNGILVSGLWLWVRMVMEHGPGSINNVEHILVADIPLHLKEYQKRLIVIEYRNLSTESDFLGLLSSNGPIM